MEININSLKWWQKAVFYQIYPRSFADGNGDGIGDFTGMLQKLDYLKDLGVDALWLSPHFPSPLFDCGYDISDYTGVAPEYGTLDDFQRFLDGAHQRGLRVILDLVLNHTSHQHAWFLESRSSRDNPKRDWYIWKDPVDGSPPNNWQSCFDGPAWELDTKTGQYYYHFFFKEQPDLNWRNPEVKEAMFQAVRFWLDRGVDGFRLDAVGTIYERPDLKPHPVPYTLAQLRGLANTAQTDEDRKQRWQWWEDMFASQVDQPGLHELMQELRQVMDEYDDRMLVAEDDNIAYHGNGENELDLVFNFPLLRAAKLSPAHIRRNQETRLSGLEAVAKPAWPCNTLGNHDSPRIFNYFGDGKHDDALARLHLALMLTLRGTPFLYNGEEIGMTDLMLADISQFRDLMGIWYYNAAVNELGVPPQEALAQAASMTRDKNRTPLQWSHAPNGGFCPAEVNPWLPVNPNYTRGVNVSDQEQDSASLLSFYRTLLHFRRQVPALIAGDYLALHEQAEDYLAFLRRASYGNETQACLVVLNFSANAHRLDLAQAGTTACLLYTNQDTHSQETISLNEVHLAPFEILVMDVT